MSERQPSGKGRFDLIPPRGLAAVALRMELGAGKYAEKGYQDGLPLSLFIDKALRHAVQLMAGDDTEDHAAACACNWLMFLDTAARIDAGLLPRELDDVRGKYT